MLPQTGHWPCQRLQIVWHYASHQHLLHGCFKIRSDVWGSMEWRSQWKYVASKRFWMRTPKRNPPFTPSTSRRTLSMCVASWSLELYPLTWPSLWCRNSRQPMWRSWLSCGRDPVSLRRQMMMVLLTLHSVWACQIFVHVGTNGPWCVAKMKNLDAHVGAGCRLGIVCMYMPVSRFSVERCMWKMGCQTYKQAKKSFESVRKGNGLWMLTVLLAPGGRVSSQLRRLPGQRVLQGWRGQRRLYSLHLQSQCLSASKMIDGKKVWKVRFLISCESWHRSEVCRNHDKFSICISIWILASATLSFVVWQIVVSWIEMFWLMYEQEVSQFFRHDRVHKKKRYVCCI